MSNIVYVLTNPAMPGIVKIGRTSVGNPQVRMNLLYTSGVPLPFECTVAVNVGDEDAAAGLESALHTAFEPDPLNPRREFSRLILARAVRFSGCGPGGRDVTPQVNEDAADLDPADIEAARRFKRRRPNLNFAEMGIEIGSTLISVRTGEEAKVRGDRLVSFRGGECSLTAATRAALGMEPGQPVRPTPHWTFGDRNLGDIYNETYILRGA